MPKLTWDDTSKRFYETGTDHGVLYQQDDKGTYPKGVAWNGLTAVTESPEGAEPTDLWADNIKYLTLRSAETFGFTVEAYTYPDEFAECNGELEVAQGLVVGQQARKAFGMCYRSVVGNDVKLNDYGYKLHLIYGATVSPSEKAYTTINDSPEAITFSWEATCTPLSVKGVPKPVYQMTINSANADPEKLKALEDILYGSENAEARLPLPEEVIELLGATNISEGGNSTTDPEPSTTDPEPSNNESNEYGY